MDTSEAANILLTLTVKVVEVQQSCLVLYMAIHTPRIIYMKETDRGNIPRFQRGTPLFEGDHADLSSSLLVPLFRLNPGD
jgi:hypothetical protein